MPKQQSTNCGLRTADCGFLSPKPHLVEGFSSLALELFASSPLHFHPHSHPLPTSKSLPLRIQSTVQAVDTEQPDKKAQRAEAPPQNPPQKDRAPPPAVVQPGSSKTTTMTTTTTPTQRSQQVAAIVLAAAGVTLTSPVPPGGLVPAAGVMLRPTQCTRQTARRGGHTSSDSSRAGSARTSLA
ncbi:hypothetical protein B0F90DRAFT_1927752 [Multifurca ochricompacta]|uniref:Uncharacterized protein n=1 Tax=Multifurca ochricompacta TaxID=376703 RepID=A0AAD4LYT0_9AGAM|nr:hypothetical protein B0F90DRAFT_1927752 [Multifurca ochricompacta]